MYSIGVVSADGIPVISVHQKECKSFSKKDSTNSSSFAPSVIMSLKTPFRKIPEDFFPVPITMQPDDNLIYDCWVCGRKVIGSWKFIDHIHNTHRKGMERLSPIGQARAFAGCLWGEYKP